MKMDNAYLQAAVIPQKNVTESHFNVIYKKLQVN